MRLSRHRPLLSGTLDITFPLLESWNPMTEVATLAAQVNKKRVLCRISVAVLRERWSVPEDNPMRAVAENRIHLQAVARRIIETKGFEEDGSVLIRSEDLRRTPDGGR